MKQYLNLIEHVLKVGIKSEDRTKVGTISTFGYQARYNLQDGFPLLTTKQVNFNAIVHELLWFISGDTNIQYLVKNNCNIWNDWPYQKYQQSSEYKNESLLEFIEKIKNDLKFAKKHGELGPVYGKQWRNFNGVDQLKNLIEEIKINPNSRRLIISSWNPAEIKEMTLPPCHTLFQIYVRDNKVFCQLYQRSADLFLGVPFNIASYSLLTMMLAHVLNLEVGEFIHTFGDLHIYQNHLEQVKEQLNRKPFPLPKVKLSNNVKSIFDFKFEDIKLESYIHHPKIIGKVAV